MKDKEWWKSKTIWSGIVILGFGVAQAFGLNVPVETVISVAGAFGLIGIRQAISNNK